jgi:membrane protease YdiL (CAAX protease family)
VLSHFANLFAPHVLIPFGPLVAALIVLPLIGGRTSLAEFWRASIRWRVGARWYAAAVALPIAAAALALGLAVLLGGSIDQAESRPWTDVFSISLETFILIGLGEELAWRGFALPRLMAGRSLLSAALILGLIHAVWHWPLVDGDMTYNQVAPVAVAIVSYSVFTGWMYTRTRGSLLLPAISHTVVNTASYFVFNLMHGSNENMLYWLWAAIWVVAGVAVAVILRGERAGGMAIAPESRAPVQA